MAARLQLTAIQGLFEVTGGIYQVRGADPVQHDPGEIDHGVIVIDPLISAECRGRGPGAVHLAAEARRMAVIYTHFHIDHFGGVLGVGVTRTPAVLRRHQERFVEFLAVGERLRRDRHAGPGSTPGTTLPVGSEGRVGIGLGAPGSTRASA